MESGFSWTISGATILTVVAGLISNGALILAFVWNRSARETKASEQFSTLTTSVSDMKTAAAAQAKTFGDDFAEIKRSATEQKDKFDAYLRQLDTDRMKWREDFIAQIDKKLQNVEKDADAKVQAIMGIQTLFKDQLAEVRENIAGNYMKKPEIEKIEQRLHTGNERIIEQLDKLHERVDDVLNAVVRNAGPIQRGTGRELTTL